MRCSALPLAPPCKRDGRGRFIKGGNGRNGYVFTDADKKKISDSLKGRFQGKDSPTWKGGRWKDVLGYIRIPTQPGTDNFIYEHRLVMEKMIGRKLRPEETVHHRNEIKDDNRPENLQLFASKGDHVRHHSGEVNHDCKM